MSLFYRRFLAAFAVISSVLYSAGAAHAGDVTYPMLSTQSTVLDTDLLAVWRASGPLAKLNASVLSGYVVNGLGKSTFLQTSNNLSELTATAATARTNLQLGTAATQNTGTSGANLCLMNQNCTWSGTEAFNAAVTFGLTTVHTGLATFNGGITDNGTLNVTGASTFGGYTTVSFNGAAAVPPSAGGGTIGWNFTGGSGEVDFWDAFSSAGTCFNFYWRTATPSAVLLASLSCGGNMTTTGFVSAAGLTSSAGLNVTGGVVTLPAASVANADLDTVNGAPGTCTASVTNSCGYTVNAQGRITGSNSASPHPAISGSTAGALETNNGSSVSWSARASGYFSSCGAGGCTLASGNGVTSVTRGGPGSYIVNFASFPNTNYTVICTSGDNGAGISPTYCYDNTVNAPRQVNNVNIQIVNSAGTQVDPAGGFNIIILQN